MWYARLMGKIKNIIFDFDGTLANTYPFIEEVIYKIAPKYGITDITVDMITEAKNLSFDELLKKYDVSKLNFFKLFFLYKYRLGKEIEKIEPFEAIPQLLSYLRNRGYNMGIITSNSKSNVKKFLKANELQHNFDFVASRILFFSKHKTITKWIKKMGWEQEETVYIGDEIRDIKEARNAGIKAISVTWGFNDREGLEASVPFRIVDSPSEVMLIL